MAGWKQQFPSFYDPKSAESWAYSPNQAAVQAEGEEWSRRFGLKPAMSDRRKVEFLIIDAQKDFCFQEGALFVGGRSGRGAIEDSRRTAEFIYRNADRITRIRPTMDTHFPLQIFFSTFWRDGAGNHPAPFTMITADDIRAGRYELDPAAAQEAIGRDGRPNYVWAKEQALFYAERLETSGRFALVIWPPHCILGSDGHALVGAVHEARMFHAAARSVQSPVAVKGGNPWTENYSVFGAEVRERHNGGQLAEKNLALVKTLIDNDAVVIAGQAASHCFRWSVDDLLTTIRPMGDDLVRKVYLLEDCTSPVVTPAMDFTDDTLKAFDKWRSEGVNVVRSTDDMLDWPGMAERLAA